MKLKFQIVTPERSVLSEEIDSLTCPTTLGYITILPKHIPLIAQLQAGELTVRNAGQTRHIAVSGGFVEVRPSGEVIILADVAEHAEEIDEARAEEARRKALQAMKGAVKLSSEEYATLSASLQKNLTRLKVAKKAHRGQFGQSRGVLHDEQS